jgi:ABC-type lipoprotein release transport system permease subunit
MKNDAYIGFRMITRQKKRSVLLVLGIAIVLAMLSAVAVIEQNTLTQNITQATMDYGNWHIAYIASGKNAVAQVQQTGLTDAVCTAYHLQKMPIEDDTYSLDLTLVSDSGYAMFTPHITEGRLPKTDQEIVVEDWYLRKRDIQSLPFYISAGGTTYRIVGVFKSTNNSIYYKMLRAFGSSELNQNLIKKSTLSSIPLINNFLSIQQKTNGTPEKPFVLIRLMDGVDIKTAVDTFAKCGELTLFPGDDIISGLHQSPFYNVNLIANENIQGSMPFQEMSANKSTQSNTKMIDIMLIAVLFIMVFVSMNIMAGSSIRELGLLSAIGLEPAHIGRIVLLQALFAALFSLPFGVLIGAGGAWLALRGSMTKINGIIAFPFNKILIDVLLSFAAVLTASIYPAWKVSHGSPLDALNARPGTGIPTNFTGWPKLERSSGKFSFSILLGLKNVTKNFMRTFLLIISAALLLAFFMSFTKEIEIQWKMGTGKSSYLSDYTIKVNEINYGDITSGETSPPTYNNNVIPVDNTFLNQLKTIASVQNVYTQSSIVDQTHVKVNDSSMGVMYRYYFKLKDSQITPQGKNVFELCDITKRDGYPNFSFVTAGIGGYGDIELNFAKQHLVEGSVDIDKMKSEPIILLPKYIQSIGNLNLPYTNLQVGDQITMVEDKGSDFSKITPVKEYTFTIGGFVDPLPFKQINGSSHGFVAIMSDYQFNKLDTRYKGLLEMYVDAQQGRNPLPQIKKLTDSRGYSVIDNKNTFESKEETASQNQYQIGLYMIFGVLALVIFLAIFNIFLSDALARKSEFALLSAVGMTNAQIFFSVVSEALFAGILGCLLGSAIGLWLLLQNAGHSFGDELLNKAQLIPWAHMGIGIFILLFACITAPGVSLAITLRKVSVQDIVKE